MRIEELAIGSKVYLKVQYKGEENTVLTKVLKIFPHGILVDPLFLYGYYIDIKDVGHARIKNAVDGREYEFDVRIESYIEDNGDKFHYLESTEERVALEYRRAERFAMECNGLFTYQNTQYSVKIQDVSSTGVGVSFSGNAPGCKRREFFTVEFPNAQTGQPIRVRAEITRVIHRENDVLVGGEFVEPDKQLLTMINWFKKERFTKLAREEMERRKNWEIKES